MRYCVLLDAMARKAVPVKAKSGESLMKIAHRLIECETLQLVPLYPDRLPKGYAAVCDENAYGKFSAINPIASWLYGADEHGAPVVRNAVVFRLRRDDFGWMTAEEATAIADGLNAVPAETMNKVLLNVVIQFGGFGTIP